MAAISSAGAKLHTSAMSLPWASSASATIDGPRDHRIRCPANCPSDNKRRATASDNARTSWNRGRREPYQVPASPSRRRRRQMPSRDDPESPLVQLPEADQLSIHAKQKALPNWLRPAIPAFPFAGSRREVRLPISSHRGSDQLRCTSAVPRSAPAAPRALPQA